LLGGAKEEASGSSLLFDGSGVEFDSDDLSAESSAWFDSDGSVLMAEGGDDETSGANLFRRSVGRRRITTLLFFDPFGVDLVVVVVDDIVGDVVRQ